MTDTIESLRERVARAICQTWGYEWDGDPDHDQTAPEENEDYDTRPSKRLYREAARTALLEMIGGVKGE